MISDFRAWISNFVNLKSGHKKIFAKTADRRPPAKILVISAFLIGGFLACTHRERGRDGIVIADSKSYEASLYRQNCAVCHGREAYGKEVSGQMIPSLRFGDAKKKSEAEIYNQIANGKLPMPAFKDQLTETEIRRMVDFVIYDLQARKKIKNSSD